MADEKQPGKAPAPGAPAPGKIDIEAVRQLLALMGEHDLAELEIEQGDTVVRLRKGTAVAPIPVVPIPAPVLPAAPATAARAGEEKLPTVNSPMVGTYYASASPEAPPFVKVGDRVGEDTVVCVIEAMKVFNEIRAETAGTIEKILARNAQAVEFGQPLFVVRPG
jgi:acetyl-CoA carboxylase biotin carboxyl carrier protein